MKLSILIPARNERHLYDTVNDIYKNAESEIEVLISFDNWTRSKCGVHCSNCNSKGECDLFVDISPLHDEQLTKANRTAKVYKTSLGQRGATNFLAQKATGDYLMKVDAHTSWSRGFDTALLNEIDDRTILAPLLLPLDGSLWTINGKKQMAQFVFDTNMVMQHAEGQASETMCLQGSAWMVSAKNYWDWNLGDETMGSWGGQGAELGIKAFLNGGRCKTTNSAYYGHVFRHSDSDFPYDRGENPGKFANEELIRRYKDKRIAPLIEKFNYPADWSVDNVKLLKA